VGFAGRPSERCGRKWCVTLPTAIAPCVPASSGNRRGEAVVYYDVLGDADNPTAALRASGPPHILVTAPGEALARFRSRKLRQATSEAHIPAGQGGLYRIVPGVRS